MGKEDDQMPVTKIQAEIALDAKVRLGEGSFWNTRQNNLWWVDIEGKAFHIFDPSSGKDRIIKVGARIGTVVPDLEGNAIVALQNGIHKLDLETEELELITNPLEHKENLRFNDGKCDPSGRFWVGSMDLDEEESIASLYRMDHDGSVKEMLKEVTISNGIVWTADRKTMYYIDTPTLKVKAFDYDDATGNITNSRTAVDIPEEAGNPDGMSIDTEGNLWIAHWGGFCVACWNPETGKLIKKVEVPAPQVTSCAFGGKDFDILYITTAREGMSEEKLKEYPQSGGIFSAKPGVKGLPFIFCKYSP
ncbi:SMP-30/gluconolactonase/LRE family protein [soil metagenome]